MGYCHKCQHDCTEKDPCPCCRGSHKYTPWYPSIPYYTDPNPWIPGQPFTTPPYKPITNPIRYTCIGGSPDCGPIKPRSRMK